MHARLRGSHSTPHTAQTLRARGAAGASVYVEVRHWKGGEGRMSLLAWSLAPVEALADLGAEPPAARPGALFLHLWRKPLEPGAPRAPGRLRPLSAAGEHDLFLTIGAAG